MTYRTLLPLGLLLTFTACKKSGDVESAADSQVDITEVPVASSDLAIIVEQMNTNFREVHFDTDSAALNDASQRALTRNITIMKEHPALTVELQGHADERGTTEYNLALGAERADAVHQYMVNGGISPRRLLKVSYGEERPEADGDNAYAWSVNRRVEFRVLSGPATVEGTLDI